MEKENQIENVASILRSVALSCKGGVLLSRLNNDYQYIEGTPIPFREMGFSSLDSMIRSMTDTVKIVRDSITGQPKVIAVANESTAHIASLVSKQRDAKPRRMNQRHRPRGTFITRSTHYTNKRVLLPTPGAHSSNRRVTFSHPMHREQPHLQIKVETPHKKKPVVASSGFEVPPRFLRHQNVSKPSLAEMVEPASQFSSYSAPLHMNTSPQPKATVSSKPFLGGLLHGSGDAVVHQKIASPKPKSVKSKRNGSVSTPPLPRQSTARELVEEYASARGIEPKYNTRKVGQKHKYFVSTLSLGNQKFQSYPVEKPTAVAAEEEVTSHAVRFIQEEEAKNKLPETPAGSAEEIRALLSRIEELVSEKPNGVWSIWLTKVYETRFRESLPALWLTLVEQGYSSTIEIEKPERMNIQKDACILRIAKMSSGTTTPTSTSSRTSVQLDEDFVPLRINEETFSPEVPVTFMLTLSEGSQLAVLVSFVDSTVNIAVRLVDHLDSYVEMSERMKAFYGKRSAPVYKVFEKKLYATYLADGDEGSWQRVQAEDPCQSNGKVKCYFVDTGDTVDVDVFALQELDPAFEQLQFQAVHMRLHGLEDFKEITRVENLQNYLLDKTLIAEVKERNAHGVAVNLYDTSGEDDVNVNDFLRGVTVSELLVCELPEVGCTGMYLLTHVTLEGEIYLRSSVAYLGLLDSELERLAEKFEDASRKVKSDLSAERLYVAKFAGDGMWHRAVLSALADSSAPEVEVFFVDYGNTSWVPLSSICELEPISSSLASYPYLALPCLLTNVPPKSNMQWTEAAVNKLYDLAPDKLELIIKVDKQATENLPARVSMYKRNQNEDYSIISINQSLEFREELFRAEDGIGSVNSAPATPSSIPHSPVPSQKPTSLCFSDRGDSLPCTSSLSNYIPDVAIAAIAAEKNTKLQSTDAASTLLMPTPDEQISEKSSSSSSLTPGTPDIPSVGELFNVFITLAASPSNFIVQPLDSSIKLDSLMRNMEEFYSSEENICDMHTCLLKEDEFYAVRHVADRKWYRVRLKNIMEEDSDTVTVHFVDFGDFSMVSMDSIQPLWNKFKDLPCQAVTASLSGIRPRFKDWEDNECFAFREMVQEKSFVSIIKNKLSSSECDFGGCKLELTLIDTSSPVKDIFLHEILIEKNLAASA